MGCGRAERALSSHCGEGRGGEERRGEERGKMGKKDGISSFRPLTATC